MENIVNTVISSEILVATPYVRLFAIFAIGAIVVVAINLIAIILVQLIAVIEMLYRAISKVLPFRKVTYEKASI